MTATDAMAMTPEAIAAALRIETAPVDDGLAVIFVDIAKTDGFWGGSLVLSVSRMGGRYVVRGIAAGAATYFTRASHQTPEAAADMFVAWRDAVGAIGESLFGWLR